VPNTRVRIKRFLFVPFGSPVASIMYLSRDVFFHAMTGMQVKGLTLKSRIRFVEKAYGKDALRGLVKHLRPETAALVSDPVKLRATAWYDLEVQSELDRAICKHLADGDQGVYRKMGAFSAEFQSFRTGGKDIRDPIKMFQMIGAVFDRYFQPGHMELVKVSDKETYLRLFEFRSVKENCLSNLGFLERSLELNGFTPVIVEETQCSEDPSKKYCEYHIKWK
jgi:hypothetical protein